MEAVTRIKLLAQRQKSVHQETELTIDWQDVTQEQLKVLAQIAIVHNIEQKMVKGLMKQERVYVRAAEFLHTPAYIPIVFDPKEKRPKPPTEEEESASVVDATLQLLLDTLTPAEIKILLGGTK